MKNKNLYLLFVLCLIALNTFAQSKATNDYYINQKGDTITGTISRRAERLNNQHFEFEGGERGERVNLVPEDVKEVYFNDGTKYISHELKNSATETRSYFFKVVTEGKLTILQLGNKRLFFLDEENNHALREISKGSEHSASGKVTYNKGMLMYLLEDQPAIAGSIKRRRELTRNGVIKAFKNYNLAHNSDPETLNHPRNKFLVSIGPSIKLSSNRLETRGEGGMHHGSFSQDKTAFYGTSMEVHLPRTSESLKVLLDLHLGRNQYYKFFNDGLTNNDIILTHYTLRISLAVRNTFTQNSQWFYQIGPGARMLLNPNVYWRVEKEADNIVSTNVSEKVAIGNNFYGYKIGAGRYFNFRKLNFALYLNYNKDFTLWENYGSDQNRHRPQFRSIDTGISLYF